MKLEPLFYVKENKLYKIEGDALVPPETLQKIEIAWSAVQLDEDSYNEEFLAQLRDTLKNKELTNTFVVLVPVVDKPLETAEQTEEFINAFNHTARRVKDCTCVAGFELPSELTDKQAFMETLAIKHAQYVYFSKDKNTSANDIVLY